MHDDQLVAALQRGEAGAVGQLVEVYGDRLLRSAFLLCRDESEAQDLVQETLIEAVRSVRRFQGRSAVYTWLHAILWNVTRHYQRKRCRMVYDNELAGSEVYVPGEEHTTDTETASSALRAALDRLSQAQRDVVILRYYEGMRIHEIARHLSVSTGTVKSRLHYAIKELQALLPAELNLFGDGGTKEMQA